MEDDKKEERLMRKLTKLFQSDSENNAAHNDPTHSGLSSDAELQDYVKDIEIEYSYGCYEERRSDSCHLLGEFISAIKRKPHEAAEIFRDNCDFRHFAPSCHRYATFLLSQAKASETPGLVFDAAYCALRKSCNRGFDRACEQFGLLAHGGTQRHGGRYPPDADTTISVWTDSCEKQRNRESCAYLATTFFKGKSVAQDNHRAARYWQIACEKDDISSCSNLGLLYRQGLGVEKSEEKADFYTNRAKILYDSTKSRPVDASGVSSQSQTQANATPIVGIEQLKATVRASSHPITCDDPRTLEDGFAPGSAPGPSGCTVANGCTTEMPDLSNQERNNLLADNARIANELLAQLAISCSDKPLIDVDRAGTEENGHISIRPYLDETQLPTLMTLISKDLSEPYSIYTYRYFLHNWPDLSFLAHDDQNDGSIVGAIVCKVDMHYSGRRRGYIAMLAVDEDYRKRQIATRLVRQALVSMNAQHCDEIVLETEITNEPALTLYRKLGFIRDKRLFRYYLNGVDAFRLKLWLTPPCFGDVESLSQSQYI